MLVEKKVTATWTWSYWFSCSNSVILAAGVQAGVQSDPAGLEQRVKSCLPCGQIATLLLYI